MNSADDGVRRAEADDGRLVAQAPSSQSGLPTHYIRAGSYRWSGEEAPKSDEHRDKVEPWLSALFQAEHLSLLVGSGLSTALSDSAGVTTVNMGLRALKPAHSQAVAAAAEKSAASMGRGTPNFEDQVRTILELVGGLRILSTEGGSDGDAVSTRAGELLDDWQSELDTVIAGFIKDVLAIERGIESAFSDDGRGDAIRALLAGFLLSFASRAASRERLHIFTTNYDRLMEFGCDLLGLRVLDRFVGMLAPTFHSSRLGVDLHYNPPGIRGEPRYLEGVIRLTKLHGSVDWRWVAPMAGRAEIKRIALPLGAADDHPEIPRRPNESILIYPNPAKDTETLEYPYAELFRDFAAAACQPNSVVVTYGYGFGDDHVNRILRDMLSLPSTHLAVISYDNAAGRLERFLDWASRPDQTTLLVGPHFAELATLVRSYLPKPAIDVTTGRMMDLLKRRVRPDQVAAQDAFESTGHES